ncbi:MAG TPA: acyl-CoA thioesterase domain-containing protein [Ilumatobacteraceae bacterium]|nr:acyl-CoA thioesterase domain-containing protein [Ilumatobacteraceae bacterium]
MDAGRLFDLEAHGPDTFVGIGPRYPWGGLYGGQIVAQALRAAAATVESDLEVHSLRAYFIRRGDHTEPIRFEVDRIRNGRSFATRRVIARQAVGAILNLEASFQRPEPSFDLQAISMDTGVPGPESLVSEPFMEGADRRFVPATWSPSSVSVGAGRTVAWMKVNAPLGDDQLLHRCWLAYLSDDLPHDSVRAATRIASDGIFSASLDHSIWFHRPVQADQWHLHDFTCHSYGGGRGLAIGHVFGPDGLHVATVAQEVLLRGHPTEQTGEHGS